MGRLGVWAPRWTMGVSCTRGPPKTVRLNSFQLPFAMVEHMLMLFDRLNQDRSVPQGWNRGWPLTRLCYRHGVLGKQFLLDSWLVF